MFETEKKILCFSVSVVARLDKPRNECMRRNTQVDRFWGTVRESGLRGLVMFREFKSASARRWESGYKQTRGKEEYQKESMWMEPLMIVYGREKGSLKRTRRRRKISCDDP